MKLRKRIGSLMLAGVMAAGLVLPMATTPAHAKYQHDLSSPAYFGRYTYKPLPDFDGKNTIVLTQTSQYDGRYAVLKDTTMKYVPPEDFVTDTMYFKGNIIEIKGDVVLYIAPGVTLRVEADYYNKAAIHLTQGNSLTVIGGGTLIAQGGQGGEGEYADQGGNAYTRGDRIYGGNGGKGGQGGGGGGAGIGGNGAPGRAGQPSANNPGWDTGDYVTSGGPDYRYVVKGSNGWNEPPQGQAPETPGELYVRDGVTALLKGGQGGKGGGAGYEGLEPTYVDSAHSKHNFCAGPGGGGGAGGVGGTGNGYGVGGIGGGGGGAGCYAGVYDAEKGSDRNIGHAPFGLGGQGGISGDFWLLDKEARKKLPVGKDGQRRDGNHDYGIYLDPDYPHARVVGTPTPYDPNNQGYQGAMYVTASAMANNIAINKNIRNYGVGNESNSFYQLSFGDIDKQDMQYMVEDRILIDVPQNVNADFQGWSTKDGILLTDTSGNLLDNVPGYVIDGKWAYAGNCEVEPKFDDTTKYSVTFKGVYTTEPPENKVLYCKPGEAPTLKIDARAPVATDPDRVFHHWLAEPALEGGKSIVMPGDQVTLVGEHTLTGVYVQQFVEELNPRVVDGEIYGTLYTDAWKNEPDQTTASLPVDLGQLLTFTIKYDLPQPGVNIPADSVFLGFAKVDSPEGAPLYQIGDKVTFPIIPTDETGAWNDTNTRYRLTLVSMNNDDNPEAHLKTGQVDTQLIHHEALAPTASNEGYVERWECPICHQMFKTNSHALDAENVLTSTEVIVPATGYTFGEEWSSDARTHWHASTPDGLKKDEAWHTYGEWSENVSTDPTKTVRERTCTICGHKDVETTILPVVHKHTDAKHLEAVAPTCVTPGNIDCYQCSCGRYFIDRNCTLELTNEQVFLPATGRHLQMTKFDRVEPTDDTAGNILYWHCADCDRYFSDADGKTQISQESTVLPALKPQPPKPAPGSGNGGSSGGTIIVGGDKTVDKEVVKNPDGSVTTTETKKNGTILETTELTNGSKQIIETRPDGTVSASTVRKDGVAVENVTTPGGKTTTNVVLPDGMKSTEVVVPAENVTTGSVVVIVRPDGFEEIVRDCVPVENGVKFTTDQTVTVKVVNSALSFDDMAEDAWYKEAVDFVTARNIFRGVSEKTFGASKPMTRGMLAQVLHNLESNPDSIAHFSFKDVPDDLWCSNAISWAADRGIVSGYSDGRFGTNDFITREQLAVMLWRYEGSPKHSGKALKFSDANNVSGYAVDAITWAMENGIISGYSNNMLNPKGNATRAQVATMLMRFVNM